MISSDLWGKGRGVCSLSVIIILSILLTYIKPIDLLIISDGPMINYYQKSIGGLGC